MPADYASRLKAHLSGYKRRSLGVVGDGSWKRRPYPHILPAGLRELNIIPSIRDPFWAWHAAKGPSLHRDFLHLNSSQAMGFNLFFPWLNADRDAQALLLGCLGLAGERLAAWEFEAIPDPKEGTNVDLLLETASARRVVVEVKLSEREFGKAVADPRHKEKLGAVYGPRLAGRVREQALEEQGFFAHYQLFRNLSLLGNPEDRFIVVFPEANALLEPEVSRFRALLAPRWQDSFAVVHLGGLWAAIGDQATEQGKDDLQIAMDEFHEKYLAIGEADAHRSEPRGTLQRALEIAVGAHRGMADGLFRRVESVDLETALNAPYVLHPIRMMLRLETRSERIAALLHDVVEDTEWTLDDLRREGFSEEVVAAVDALTARDGEPYESFIDRVVESPIARRVKRVDMEDNMDVRRIDELADKDLERLRKYRRFWERLR